MEIGKSACCCLNEITCFTYHFYLSFSNLFQTYTKNLLLWIRIRDGIKGQLVLGYRLIRSPGWGMGYMDTSGLAWRQLSKVE